MKETVPPPPSIPIHLNRCLSLFDMYRKQGRPVGSIRMMLKAVGADRYLAPWIVPRHCHQTAVAAMLCYLRPYDAYRPARP